MMLSDQREILLLESNLQEFSTKDLLMVKVKVKFKVKVRDKVRVSHSWEGWLVANSWEGESQIQPHTKTQKPQFYEKKLNHSTGCDSARRSLQQFTELNSDAIEHISSLVILSKSLDCIQSSMNSVFNHSNSTINQFRIQYYGVFNISDYKCDDIELSVLGKGLKFCPTPPKYCHGQMKESIDKFFQSCSLKLFFDSSSLEQQPEDILEDSFLSEEEQEIASDHKVLTFPSTFTPTMPGTLEHIYSILIDRILSHSPDLSRNRNMTSAQYKAMTRLKENENIVIKKADKGSSIVIQNKIDYTKEGLRQLGDTKFYKR